MIILPAIDLIGGKVVRLTKGDYDKMTVYGDDPVKTAAGFKEKGAEYAHIVDLDGAKTGGTPNLETIRKIISDSGLMVQVGGGIRSRDVIEKYLSAGAVRVILGTAAVKDPELLVSSVKEYGDKIAVGVDIKDGLVAIKGWTEASGYTCHEFCQRLQDIGVKTVICTDISKDGMLSGANTGLYRELSQKFTMDFIASGGVTTCDDIRELKDMGMYGAILGRAMYTGAIKLEDALKTGGEKLI